MKRISFFFFCSCICLISTGQPQRLALLPSTMKLAAKEGGFVPSLCIDYLRSEPGEGIESFDNYSHLELLNGSTTAALQKYKFDADNYSNITIKNAAGRKVTPALNQPLFLSTQDDLSGISANYKKFINLKISEYKKPGFNSNRLNELQYEIWQYNALETLGYIKQGDAILPGYTAAKKRFAQDFALRQNTYSEGGILTIAKDIHDLNLDEKSEKNIHYLVITKNSQTKEYVVFRKDAPPIYRGLNEDELIKTVSQLSDVQNGDDMNLLLMNFENAEKEEAFTVNVKRKLEFVHDKNVGITNGYKSAFDYEGKYSLTREMSPDNIIENSATGLFTGSIELKEVDWDQTLTIEATSTKKNLLLAFFDRLTTQLKSFQDKINIYRLNKKIKKEVLEGIERSQNQLDIFINGQGGSKSVVNIDNLSVKTVMNSYARK